MEDSDLTQAAGWYADSENVGKERYWDGVRWTEHRRAVATASAPPPPPATTPPPPPPPSSGLTAPTNRQPVQAPPSTGGLVAPGAGYAAPAKVTPGTVHSFILLGTMLALTSATVIFIISAAFAAAASYFAVKAGRAANRGEMETAVSSSARARQFRIVTYITIPITGIIALILFALLVGAVLTS